MKDFIKMFWAALVAFLVANVVLVFLSFILFGAMMASLGAGQSVSVKKGSVLKLDLSEQITDSPSSSPFGNIDWMTMSRISSNSVLQVLTAIDYAANDKKIEGIYITSADMVNMSAANAEEIRAALLRFKESGKWIVCYSETYSHLGYYLGTVADKVYVNPKGDLAWIGVALTPTFIKGTLDKMGLQTEVFRHGTFKSAIEPYVLDKMSPANRQQMTTLVQGLWNTIVEAVSQSRGIAPAVLNDYADKLTVRSAAWALQCGMVDGLLYRDQIIAELNERLGMEPDTDENIEVITMSGYISAVKPAPGNKSSKNKIAMIYVDGQIVDGESTDGAAGGNTIARKLEKARKDENVKAVVLRVNSPGGSALASEIIWREMDILRSRDVDGQAVGKPVIVSMGDYAASGGYYISAPADVIISNRMTLTGSIGVFGMLINGEKMFREKLGLTTDVVKTNKSADFGRGIFFTFRGATQAERDYLMYSVEDTYNTFVDHVAKGRNLSDTRVDEIGQGRVWLGVNAGEIGLVDRFGSIQDAIALAAQKAGLEDDYHVTQYLDHNDSLSAVLGLMAQVRESAKNAEVRELESKLKTYQRVMRYQGVQAIMPYRLEIR